MKDLLISIGSITYAMKAKKVLSSNLLSARVVKTGTGDGRSCVYGILISPKDRSAVTQLLTDNGIDFTI